jgi:ketosteroid isomerase-like protein
VTTADDADAIRRLLFAYSDGVLHRDVEQWRSLWTDDARWVLDPQRSVDGVDAIVEQWVTAMEAYEHVVQVYLGNTATVDGDTAGGRANFIELTVPVGRPRQCNVGWYDDEYRRTAAGWKFTRRVFQRLYSGPPDLSGTFFQRRSED